MIWALFAALGVPIWLVVGGLAAVLWSRRQFSRTPGVFKVKVRMYSGTFDGLGGKWPFKAARALWIHDVLVVHKGLAMVRTIPVPVAAAEGRVEKADPRQVKRLGDNLILLRFRLDNGATMELAAPEDTQRLAYGPFTSHFAAEEPRVAVIPKTP